MRYADPDAGGEETGSVFAPPPGQGESGRERHASPSTNQNPADYSQVWRRGDSDRASEKWTGTRILHFKLDRFRIWPKYKKCISQTNILIYIEGYL